MKISDFDYDLPKERIPDRPLATRGQSKMLVFDKGGITHSRFPEISTYLKRGDLLILNNTKVIPARLAAQKPSGGRAELLLVNLKSHGEDYQLAMTQSGSSEWKTIIGGKRISAGDELKVVSRESEVKAAVLSKDGMYGVIRLEYPAQTLGEILQDCGNIPLPPYMNREADERDRDDYQTVFAKYEGSVAAPTASLHLTDEILADIKAAGVEIEELTLHVGPGTFMPVTEDDPTQHEMHAERIQISYSTVSRVYEALKSGRRIIASGTTAMRSLESLAAIAYRIGKGEGADGLVGHSIGHYTVEQFPYSGAEANVEQCVLAGMAELMKTALDFKQTTLSVDSKIMLMPGHPYFITQGLITNFHLPKSTLLLLVASFVGTDNLWRIYDAALDGEYRFLSYGDGSLLFQ